MEYRFFSSQFTVEWIKRFHLKIQREKKLIKRVTNGFESDTTVIIPGTTLKLKFATRMLCCTLVVVELMFRHCFNVVVAPEQSPEERLVEREEGINKDVNVTTVPLPHASGHKSGGEATHLNDQTSNITFIC